MLWQWIWRVSIAPLCAGIIFIYLYFTNKRKEKSNKYKLKTHQEMKDERKVIR